MATRDAPDTPELRAVADARAAYTRAEDALTAAREKLRVRMVAAGFADEKISHIARAAGYEQAYVRRVLRLAGVKPKQPKRIPPPGFKRAADPVDAE